MTIWISDLGLSWPSECSTLRMAFTCAGHNPSSSRCGRLSARPHPRVQTCRGGGPGCPLPDRHHEGGVDLLPRVLFGLLRQRNSPRVVFLVYRGLRGRLKAEEAKAWPISGRWGRRAGRSRCRNRAVDDRQEVCMAWEIKLN